MRPRRIFDAEVAQLNSMRLVLADMLFEIATKPASRAKTRAVNMIDDAEKLLSGAATALREAHPLKETQERSTDG